MGVSKQADGSSFFELGNTKVLASVYGPHNVSEVYILVIMCNLHFVLSVDIRV